MVVSIPEPCKTTPDGIPIGVWAVVVIGKAPSRRKIKPPAEGSAFIAFCNTVAVSVPEKATLPVSPLYALIVPDSFFKI